MSTLSAIIFSIVFIISIGFFAWSCFRRYRLVARGKSENRFDAVGKRLLNMLVYGFGQRKVLGRRYGINHMILFWCFIILLIANAGFILSGLFPDILAFSKLPSPVYKTLVYIFDILSGLVLVAIIIAIVRRIFFPPYSGARNMEGFAILIMVFLLMSTYFGLHAIEISQHIEKAEEAMPISNSVASLFMKDISQENLATYANLFWWLHALILLGFLNYLPYSKHMHIISAIPNCFFKRLDNLNSLRPEHINKDKNFGVGQVYEFTWKDLFDSYSCTECGRCTSVCPPHLVGKTLDPQRIVLSIKTNLLKNGYLHRNDMRNEIPLIGNNGKASISPESIWECTTCGACVEVCPVCIEQYPKIIDMRRHLVLMKGSFGTEIKTAFRNMSNHGNPWGKPWWSRSEWLNKAKLNRLGSCSQAEIVLWVGCVDSFDDRNNQVVISLARILQAAGLNFAILGNEEWCCGDPARRLGEEYLFQLLAARNIETLKKHGVREIVTACPHCYNTIKNEYPQFGGDFQVTHHTELLARLMAEGKIRVSNRLEEDVVYQDPCYLGRYNGIYESPRNLLRAMYTRPLEMESSRNNSLCCGGGGGHMWLAEHGKDKINRLRVRDAGATNATMIATACPYCLTMLEDGISDEGELAARIRVMDIAELIERTL